jgi:hypothetical protein
MGVGLLVLGDNFTYPQGVRVLPLSDVTYSTQFVFGWAKGKRSAAVDHMIEIVKSLSIQE